MAQKDAARIWNKFAHKLSDYILRKVNNREIANDISLDVFLKLYQNLPNLKEEERIHGWLYRVTHNSIMDYYRNQKKLDWVLLREMFDKCCIIEHDAYGNIIHFRPRCSCK